MGYRAGAVHIVGPNPEPRFRIVYDWLGSVETPVGVMLADDHLATVVTQACRAIGLGVGRDVGLIGVNNDEAICETVSPGRPASRPCSTSPACSAASSASRRRDTARRGRSTGGRAPRRRRPRGVAVTQRPRPVAPARPGTAASEHRAKFHSPRRLRPPLRLS